MLKRILIVALASLALPGAARAEPALDAFRVLNTERPGFGFDVSRAEPQEHAMGYAFHATAAVNLGKIDAARKSAEWLIANAGPHGWGLGWSWDAFGDGTPNPADSAYGIETAVGVRALLDVFDATGDRHFSDAALKALDGYSQSFTATKEGGFFWYSDNKNDAVQVTNVSAMLAGQYARSAKLFGREDHRKLAEAALGQLMRERKVSSEGGAWWPYGSTRPAANDAVHAAHVVIGIADAARYLGGSIDLSDEASHLLGFVSGDTVLEEHPLVSPERPRVSARAGGIAIMAAALAEAGFVKDGLRIAEVLKGYQAETGQFCYRDKVGCGFPRTQSQVAGGLARLKFLASGPAGRAAEVVKHAAFSPRDSARGFEFGDFFWLSNGYFHGDVEVRDIYRSKDGERWETASKATPYDAYSGMAVHDGWIWAANRSLWRSRDGEKWEQVLADAPFADHQRNAQARLLAFKGKLWFLGAHGIWSSADGRNWEQAPMPAFGERGGYSATVWNGRIWVIGGANWKPAAPAEVGYPDRTTLRDVWSSADGLSWELVTDTPEWSPRTWHATVAHGGFLYVLAGYDGRTKQNLGDTWRSKDGKTWEQVPLGPSFSARHFPTAFSRGDDILVVAGNEWPVLNDIWRLRLP